MSVEALTYMGVTKRWWGWQQRPCAQVKRLQRDATALLVLDSPPLLSRNGFGRGSGCDVV